MKIEVDFKKSFLFLVIVSSVLYLGIFLINAYNFNFNQDSGQASVFGHSADEVVVNMSDGSGLRTVQSLLSDGVQGGLTSITAGIGLTGGTITETGTIELDTSYTDTRYVRKTGDTMSGVLNMGGNRIINLEEPGENSHAATKGYVDHVASSSGCPAGYQWSYQGTYAYCVESVLKTASCSCVDSRLNPCYNTFSNNYNPRGSFSARYENGVFSIRINSCYHRGYGNQEVSCSTGWVEVSKTATGTSTTVSCTGYSWAGGCYANIIGNPGLERLNAWAEDQCYCSCTSYLS